MNKEVLQAVRLFDVFILAPFMIKIGRDGLPDRKHKLLIIAGIGTAVFNGVNFINNLK